MKFSEFDRIINPKAENIYIVESNRKQTTKLSLQEVKKLSSLTPTTIIKVALPKDLIVFHIKKNTTVLNALMSEQLNCIVVEYDDEYYIWFKGSFNLSTDNNLLACGIGADVYGKKGHDIIVPFYNPNYTLTKATIVYETNRLEDYPIWFKPMRKTSSNIPLGIQVPIVNNAQLILQEHYTNISSLNKYDQEDVLNIINKYFMTLPMTQQELDNFITILKTNLLASFVDNKGQLMHWTLGDYVTKSCNIKRDKVSKGLYFYNEKKNIYTNDEEFLNGYLTKLIPQLKQYQKEEVIKYIYNSLYDETVTFNKNEYSVVFKNGILDLKTWQFEPMTPDHLESIQINVSYDPSAYSKTADEFFATATCGDKMVEQLLYEAIGYALLKTNDLAKSFILTGTGRNGKSTYFDIMKAILGEGNFASISFKDLTSTFRASMLMNKLASFAGDISAQPIQESDLFKSITAYEDVTLEQKYKDAIVAKLFSTMFFSCNKLPRTPDTTYGFYRRMVIIPFNADLTKVTTVDGIKFKRDLLSEESLNYITYKALKAIYNVLNTTLEFTEPQCVKDMLTKYKVDNSTVLSWFAERYNNDKKILENSSINKVYGNYTAWCAESGRVASSKTTFRQQVEADIGVQLKDN